MGVASNLAISAGDASVELMWDLVNSAQSYRVEWFSDPPENLSTSNGTASHGPLATDRRYTYIYTVQVDGQTVVLSAAPVAADPTAPATVAITSGPADNTLSWSPVSGATGYRVYWSYEANVSPATGTPIDVDGSQTSYAHTDLDADAGTHYHYVVTALLSDGTQGVASAEVGARPGPTVAVTAAVSAGQVDLTWPGNSGSVTVSASQTFEVSSTPFPLGDDDEPTPVTVDLLENDTRYAFRVRPVFAEGAGPASTTVFATPKALASGVPASVKLTAGRGVNTLVWEPVPSATSYEVTWSATDLSGNLIGDTVTGITEPRFRQSGLYMCPQLGSSCPTYSYSVRTTTSADAPKLEALSVDLRPVPPLVTNTNSVILAGVKPSGTRVDIKDSSGAVIKKVPTDRAFDRETGWTATVPLDSDGTFTFRLVAIDESGLASIETQYQVTRDMTAPDAASLEVTTVSCATATASTKKVTLSGDKDSGTAVFRELEPDAPDQQIVGATAETSWSGVIEVGNAIDRIKVTAKDAAGNASSPPVTVYLSATPAPPPGAPSCP